MVSNPNPWPYPFQMPYYNPPKSTPNTTRDLPHLLSHKHPQNSHQSPWTRKGAFNVKALDTMRPNVLTREW